MTQPMIDICVGPSNLAQVIYELERNSRLSKTKRRDLISAVNCTANLIGRQPFELNADVSDLRQALLKIHPVQAGITAKRLANIKSDLGQALRVTRAAPRQRRNVARTDAWLDFLQRVDAKHQRSQLARFVTYCCNHGIEPDEVSDDVMEGFEVYLDARILTKEPKAIRKESTQTWNAVIRRAGLPFRILAVPRADRYIATPLDQYPRSLQTDFAKYIDRLRHADIMDEEGPDKALSDISLRNIEAHVRQFLDAVCANGFAQDDFQSLADIVEPEAIKAGVTKIRERQGGRLTATVRNILATLQAIAKYHVKAPETTVQMIRRVKTKVSEFQIGMTDKNMERLAQFDDPMNIARLLTLPDKLMQSARSNSTAGLAPLRAMQAVAISILLACPLRIKNLAMLDIERHLTVQRDGRRKRFMVNVSAKDVKNNNSVDFDLGEQQSALLETYLSAFRQQVSDNPGSFLFPKKSGGGFRSPAQLGSELSGLIYRETGLVMNAHLFRHFAGMMFLTNNPGEFETVRRILGHRKLDTTTSFYARFSNKAAVERYDTTVLSKWRGYKND
ncbi:site-specific tyrosine recombinase XerC [Roseovarius sp. A-2]|uniref:tyrosine-type recombinase/integrase n=1 Tax=Roseovarius sp. A-2 TaxID=1570360 RepID=UPI0009B58CAE|nr:tyrosine-type recombinase/integrase [Roseovarius sp. A-2]GAW37433.1 site-specific tyrosine recombinase XerC [Roseovarius sp. A-2]